MLLPGFVGLLRGLHNGYKALVTITKYCYIINDGRRGLTDS